MKYRYCTAKHTVPYRYCNFLTFCMGTAIICHGLLSLVVLYWVVSRFVARLLVRKIRAYHCAGQLRHEGHGSGNLSMHAVLLLNSLYIQRSGLPEKRQPVKSYPCVSRALTVNSPDIQRFGLPLRRQPSKSYPSVSRPLTVNSPDIHRLNLSMKRQPGKRYPSVSRPLTVNSPDIQRLNLSMKHQRGKRRESLLDRLSCSPDDPIDQGTELNWTELNWLVQPWYGPLRLNDAHYQESSTLLRRTIVCSTHDAYAYIHKEAILQQGHIYNAFQTFRPSHIEKK